MTHSKKLKKFIPLPPGVANPVDVHVGGRLRLRRVLLGVSLSKLARMTGLTFQQIQKYERANTRISASRLFEFSLILDVPVSWFFEDMPEELKTHEGRVAAALRGKKEESGEIERLARQESLKLVLAYYKITDPVIRQHLCKLIKSLA